jgi:hypothetical protein
MEIDREKRRREGRKREKKERYEGRIAHSFK